MATNLRSPLSRGERTLVFCLWESFPVGSDPGRLFPDSMSLKEGFWHLDDYAYKKNKGTGFIPNKDIYTRARAHTPTHPPTPINEY